MYQRQRSTQIQIEPRLFKTGLYFVYHSVQKKKEAFWDYAAVIDVMSRVLPLLFVP